MRSIGDSKASLYFLLLSTVINIILDYCLLAWLNMGVAGAAWATVRDNQRIVIKDGAVSDMNCTICFAPLTQNAPPNFQMGCIVSKLEFSFKSP